MAWEWRRHWRLLGFGDESGDFAAGNWRRRYRPSGWILETTLTTQRLGSANDTGDLAAGIGDHPGDLAAGD